MTIRASIFNRQVKYYPYGRTARLLCTMATAHYLRPLLAPNSVVLCGASERPGSLGRIVYENLLAGGFRGDLFATNPAHATVLGRRTFPSLTAIAEPVELAVICTPPSTVPALIAECKGRARAAVVMSGAPTARAAEYALWRREITASARAAEVPVLGPASFGVMRTTSGLNATYGAVPALPGRLTLISQSGAVAGALLDFARTAHIGFASVIVLGAVANIDFGELLEFALADEETDGIVLYVETLRDARPFMSALRAAARTKPVVVLKAGRYDKPGESPETDKVFDAALKRAGTVRVHSYTQLFAAARLLAAGRIPKGDRLAIVTNGRGPGLLAADCARELGVRLAEFEEGTRTALTALLPSNVATVNPVDVCGEATPERLARAVGVCLSDAATDAVVALHVAAPASPPTDSARAVASVAKGARKPVLAAWLGSVDRPDARAALDAGGIADFYTPENAVEAFSFLAAYRHNQEWLLQAPAASATRSTRGSGRSKESSSIRLAEPELETPDLVAAARVRKVAVSAGRAALNAGEARRLLAAFGIAMAQQKSRLTVSASVNEVKAAIFTDCVFGPVIALGTPGVSAQAMPLMLAPLNRRLACDLIEAAQLPRLRSPVEVQNLLLRMSALACMLPWATRVELDPVRVGASGALVAKARIAINRSAPDTPSGYRHMAIHPYPVELETTLALPEGKRLRVRPIRPEDADLERAFVAGLSDETRYRRFMQHLHELTPQMLARFTQVDYDRELALIALDAVSGRGKRREKIVAVARYVGNVDGESAEFAITIADAWQRRGLGWAMMELLIARVRDRGYARLIGNVLAINTPMLGLASALGFSRAIDPEDPEQVIVTLDLRGGRTRGTPGAASSQGTR